MKTCWGGVELPLSWSPVQGHTSDTEPEGEQFISFYIMLDAYYPWLQNMDDKDSYEINAGESVSVIFDSYHAGDQLEFEGLPEWLQAKAEGRYDKTTVTFTAIANAPAKGETTVKVKGQGVCKEVKFNNKESGIGDILSEDTGAPATYYTLDGKNVTGVSLAPGIYIKRQGNKAEKIIVR